MVVANNCPSFTHRPNFKNYESQTKWLSQKLQFCYETLRLQKVNFFNRLLLFNYVYRLIIAIYFFVLTNSSLGFGFSITYFPLTVTYWCSILYPSLGGGGTPPARHLISLDSPGASTRLSGVSVKYGGAVEDNIEKHFNNSRKDMPKFRR